ncbi:hypothetical protein LJB82_02730 [Desulfovibrio sp. OttesenSCG-928-M16]|nr:hypothetical protein [Desulfovibrio sp. OttesenSCG-928-M16]
MAENRIIIPYKPRPLQKLVHEGRKRQTVLITHRRFGKTVCAVSDQLRRSLMHGASVRAWRAGYVAPYLKQAKKIAWDYLKYFAGAIPGVKFNESELCCSLPNGARLALYGADNPDSLRGLYFDDLVLDEAADIDRPFWSMVLRPTLADRGGWALFTGTPQGVNNLLYDVYQQALADAGGWASFSFKASETGYVLAEELEKARADMSEDEYMQEFECSFAAAVRGAYWAREIDDLERNGRIGSVPFEPLLPVYTAWDLGMDDAMSIWFWQRDRSGDWRIFDYYENSGEGLEHYADIVLCRHKGHWAHGQQRRYARHIGPHDIMVRELGTGKSRFEVARGLGINFSPCRNIPVIDGINAARRQLARCRFDAARCGPGLLALRQYHKTYNSKMDIFGKPVHDWTSHPSDAFRYAAVGMLPEAGAPRSSKTVNKKPFNQGEMT